MGAAVAGSSAGDGIEVMPGTYTEQVVVDRRLDIFGAPGGQRPVITFAGSNGDQTFRIGTGGAGTTARHLDIEATGPNGLGLDAVGNVRASDLVLSTTGPCAVLDASAASTLGPGVTATASGDGAECIEAGLTAADTVTGVTVTASGANARGVGLGGVATLADSTVNGDTALVMVAGIARRVTANGRQAGVRAEPGSFLASIVSDSVITSSASGGAAAEAITSLGGGALTLRDVTAVASGGGSHGLLAHALLAPFAGGGGTIDARNVVARGNGRDVAGEPARSPCPPGESCAPGTVTIGYSNFLTTFGPVDTGSVGHNQSADPLLANPVVGPSQDFHIASFASPLIGAGIADPANGPSDRDGVAHPSAPAIGAYEYGGPGPPARGPAGGPRGGVLAAEPAPVLTATSMLRTRFRVARAATPLMASRARRGSAFRFTLNEPAAIQIRIYALAAGRRAHRKCLKKRKAGRKCTLLSLKGGLTRAGKTGANHVPFSGRIGTRALKRGRYQATIAATNAGGTTVRAVSFTILER